MLELCTRCVEEQADFVGYLVGLESVEADDFISAVHCRSVLHPPRLIHRYVGTRVGPRYEERPTVMSPDDTRPAPPQLSHGNLHIRVLLCQCPYWRLEKCPQAVLRGREGVVVENEPTERGEMVFVSLDGDASGVCECWGDETGHGDACSDEQVIAGRDRCFQYIEGTKSRSRLGDSDAGREYIYHSYPSVAVSRCSRLAAGRGVITQLCI